MLKKSPNTLILSLFPAAFLFFPFSSLSAHPFCGLWNIPTPSPFIFRSAWPLVASLKLNYRIFNLKPIFIFNLSKSFIAKRYFLSHRERTMDFIFLFSYLMMIIMLSKLSLLQESSYFLIKRFNDYDMPKITIRHIRYGRLDEPLM